MSRSRRKTPVMPITTAESDKAYKTREHRRERAHVREALAQGNESKHPKAFGNPWSGDKDGKQYAPHLKDAWRK
ncbi:MAG: hypothetical protein DI637_06380 [Citromicrobium sp.]|nr:MAG: hypothetical protein DI637_06380 [Citromicrobium sp.]